MRDAIVTASRQSSLLARAAAWLRDRHDAAVLDVARENGAVLDFPHPVNRLPLWAWMRPHILRASLPLVLAGNFVVPWLLGRTPKLLVGLTAGLPEVGMRVLILAIEVGLVSLVTARVGRPLWKRIVVGTYHRYQWRAASALEGDTQAALERERTPRRLLPPAEPASR